MSDPNRIDPLLAKLRTYWLAHPDLRFGQIVSNFSPMSRDPFYVEDSEIVACLDAKLASAHDESAAFGWCAGCRMRCFVTKNNRTRCCDRLAHRMPPSAFCSCSSFAEERIGVMDCEGHKLGCEIARAPFYSWLAGAAEVTALGQPLGNSEQLPPKPICDCNIKGPLCPTVAAKGPHADRG